MQLKNYKKKARKILESFEGMEVGDCINVMVLALSCLIESGVKKDEQGECVENITELLNMLLVEGGEE